MGNRIHIQITFLGVLVVPLPRRRVDGKVDLDFDLLRLGMELEFDEELFLQTFSSSSSSSDDKIMTKLHGFPIFCSIVWRLALYLYLGTQSLRQLQSLRRRRDKNSVIQCCSDFYISISMYMSMYMFTKKLQFGSD